MLDNELPDGTHITDLINTEGQTLLHLCALNNMQKPFNTIMLAVKEKYQNDKGFKEKLKAWVNFKSFKEGFTALHYSSYRGNTEIA